MEEVVREPLEISPALSAKLANTSFVMAALVVLMHTVGKDAIADGSAVWWFKRLVRDVFSFSAVPYFFAAAGFFLAGHCLQPSWWLSAIRKRVRTLLIPYAVFVGLGIAADCLSSNAGQFGVGCFLEAIGLKFQPPTPTALWFVRTLFMLTVLSPLAFAIARNGFATAACVGLLFGAELFLATQYGRFGTWAFFLPPSAFMYFTIGMRLRFSPIRLPGSCVIWIIGLAFALVSLTVFEGVYSRMLMVPIALGLVFMAVPSKTFPKIFVRNTFAIYLIHPFVIAALFAAERYVGFDGLSGRVLIAHLSFFAIAFAGSLVVAEVLRMTVPKVSAIVFGGR